MTETVPQHMTDAAAGAAEAAQHGAGMPQLDFATFPSQLFWLTVTFACLYYIVTRHILPQIANVLEHRQEKVSGDLERAQTLRNEAEHVKQEYMLSLNKARQEANAFLKTTSERIEAMREERTRKLEDSLASQLTEAHAKLEKRRSETRARLQQVSETLAADVVARVTGQRPADADVRDALNHVRSA